MSSSSQSTYYGSVEDLIAQVEALPKGTSIGLPITIVAINILGGVEATLGSQRIRINDMTSMGISLFPQVQPGVTVWMEGHWGDMITLPIPEVLPAFSVMRIGAVVPPNTPLALIYTDVIK